MLPHFHSVSHSSSLWLIISISKATEQKPESRERAKQKRTLLHMGQASTVHDRSDAVRVGPGRGGKPEDFRRRPCGSPPSPPNLRPLTLVDLQTRCAACAFTANPGVHQSEPCPGRVRSARPPVRLVRREKSNSNHRRLIAVGDPD